MRTCVVRIRVSMCICVRQCDAIIFNLLEHCSLKFSSAFKSVHPLFGASDVTSEVTSHLHQFSTHSHHLRELPGCCRGDPQVRGRPGVLDRHLLTPDSHLQRSCLVLAGSPTAHFKAPARNGAARELHRNTSSVRKRRHLK